MKEILSIQTRSLLSRLAAGLVACLAATTTFADTVDVDSSALDAFSRSYFPGMSGQIVFVPKRNTTFLKGWKRFEHGSPWAYDTHIPLLFYGPGFVKKGEYSDPVSVADIAPTQYQLLGLAPPATVTGEAIGYIFKSSSNKPKVMATLVLDGVGYSLIEEHIDSMPHLKALRRDGGWLTNNRIDYLPAATAVTHAVVGTGSHPSLTGIVANKVYSAATGKMEVPWLEEKSITPKNLAVRTLADYWDLQMDNRAIVAGVCWIPRAVGGMIGHGAYITNADKDIFVAYNKKTGELINNADFYTLPEYLRKFNVRDYWERHGSEFLGHRIDGFSKVRFSPVMPRFMGDIFLEILAREPIGADNITDLLYLNLKAADMTGHKYGRESRETAEVLVTIDEYIGKIVSALTTKVGRNNFVFTLTADHGMVPSPEITGGERVYWKDLEAELAKAFDRNGDKRRVFRGYSGYNIYIDKEELANNGFVLEDVKHHLMDDPRVHAAFTETEVIANIPKLKKLAPRAGFARR